jgi:hypothetical protein
MQIASSINRSSWPHPRIDTPHRLYDPNPCVKADPADEAVPIDLTLEGADACVARYWPPFILRARFPVTITCVCMQRK